MNNPYVFIVGCPRSGTTLLKRLVDTHPDVTITHETHWIAEWYEKRRGLTSEGMVTPDLISRLVEYHRFPRWPMKREDLERLLAVDEQVSYADFVTGFYNLYSEKRGKRLVGDKTPRYVRYIPTLHQLWPHARFVHIIRDGRDVCLSAIDWRSGGELRRRFIPLHEDRIATTALWWEWLVRTGRDDGSSLGPKLYHELRYESLVSRPVEECAKLCDFLGISFDAAMLRFHEGREQIKPGRSAKRAWLRVTAGLRDWRSEMPAEDVERFEAAAGDLLEELGYPQATWLPGSEALRTASLTRDSFAQELLAGGDRPPRSWEG